MLLYFIRKRREFIVEENDITTILSVVNRETGITNYNIGNCGWKDEPTKWFVVFYTSEKSYRKVMKILTKIGKFTVNTRPAGMIDLCFEKT